MSEHWQTDRLGKYCYIKARIGWRGLAASEYTEEGPFLIAGKHIDGGCIDWNAADHISKFRYDESSEIALAVGDVILSKDGTIGRVARIDSLPGEATINGTMMLLRPMRDINYRFLYHVLNGAGFKKLVEDKVSGSSIPHIFQRDMVTLPVSFPPMAQQAKLAEILDTLDTAIQETEAIIAKLQALKQGLLHDLLTRGIDEHGELRPPQAEAPHLYKQSPLGWVPKGWDIASLGALAESLVDGPFGSNLKTAHYVENPGVRVVRLQNIVAGEYDDTERAFISDRHATSLERNRVTAGDVLIASLGDTSHPVGRSCCYPTDLPDAINKADCFRFRSGPRCLNEFVMHSMNGVAARKQVRGYEQGVTMKRINLGNLRRIEIALPPITEQRQISERIEATQEQITTSLRLFRKLREQKAGLMDDLLTGRVRVTTLLEEGAHDPQGA